MLFSEVILRLFQISFIYFQYSCQKQSTLIKIRLMENNHADTVGILRANWYQNGHLVVFNYGTAFAVSNRLLLTCTHNVYSLPRKQYATELFFIPALSTGKLSEAYRKYKCSAIKSYPLASNQNQKPVEKQLTLLLLEEDLPIHDFMLIGQLTHQEEQNELLVVGYPSRTYFTTVSIDEVSVRRCINKGLIYQKEDESHVLNYTMTTGIGFSGGPVVVKHKQADRYKIVGIHTHRGHTKEYNCGLKFNPHLLNILQEWIKQLERLHHFQHRQIYEPESSFSGELSETNDSDFEQKSWEELSELDKLSFSTFSSFSEKDAFEEDYDIEELNRRLEEDYENSSLIMIFDDQFGSQEGSLAESSNGKTLCFEPNGSKILQAQMKLFSYGDQIYQQMLASTEG